MFKVDLLKLFQTGVVNNIQIVTGFGVGLIFAGIYQRFVTIRKIEKAYERIIKEKEDNNTTLKVLISERLEQIQVEEVHKSFFKRVRKYFKHTFKNN